MVWGETVAPTPAVKVNDSLIGSIAITLGIVNACLGAVETHSASGGNIVEVALEISVRLFRRVDNIYGVGSTRGNTASV